MPFITENMYNYESDVYNRMKYIDNYFDAAPLFSIESASNVRSNNTQSFSLYGKKMEKQMKLAENLLRDTDNEIKRVDSMIKKYSNNPKNTKYEMEATNTKSNLLSMKLNIIKTMADFETKVKKSQDDDLKLMKDLNNLPGAGMSIGTSVSGDDAFLNDFLSTSPTESNPYSSFDIPASDFSNLELPKYEEPKQIEEEKPALSLDDMKQTVPEPIPVDIATPKEPEGYIVNALGQTVPIVSDYEGDFKDGTLSSAKLSAENIKIQLNPNIKEFFKYNKDEKMGYMVYYDTETNKEVKEGTHLPLKLLYPFEIDTTHNMVTTKMMKDYPLIYTSEPVPDDVREEWKTLDKIYRKIQIDLADKRAESIPDPEEEE